MAGILDTITSFQYSFLLTPNHVHDPVFLFIFSSSYQQHWADGLGAGSQLVVGSKPSHKLNCHWGNSSSSCFSATSTSAHLSPNLLSTALINPINQ